MTGSDNATGTTVTRWVSFGDGESTPLDAPVTVPAAVDFARSLGSGSGSTAGGRTRATWELLATLACADLGAARVIEPHLDALSILRGARENGFDAPSVSSAVWGVFAAEGGADPLGATPADSGWTLQGTKQWCSLADRLDRALEMRRQLHPRHR